MTMPRRGLLSSIVLIAACLAAAELSANERLFPRPPELEPAVRFWTRVYTEVDTRAGFIHDNLRMDVVYETVRFAESTTPQQRRREIDRKTESYRQILHKLAGGARSNLSREEQRVLDLWPAGVSASELRAAADRIRFQLGQADRFRAGLVRAGAWKPYIYQVLEQRGLPRELAVLPHVESSYEPTAYSRVGAAGMWQFMPSTGVRYMRIDHIVDERRDPFLSSNAAARLLEDNYAILGTWPLAITAYNHGVGGMRRAVSQLGTTDMATIVRSYNGRTFGFASRNFYAAFLAALEVDSNPEKYFGRIVPHRPAELTLATMPSYMSISTVASALRINERTLREHNPALLDAVWRGDKYVPRGFQLRVPRQADLDVAAVLAAVPASQAFAAQLPDVEHRVRQGDTLSAIARRYNLSVASLMAANNLRSSDFIRAGQVLRLPVPAGSAPAVLARTEQEAARGEPVVARAEPVVTDGVYVVRAGDSIERIARALDVDQESLLAANDIRNRNRIYAGQELRVPARGESAGPAVAVVAAAALDAEAPATALALLESEAVADEPELAAAIDAPALAEELVEEGAQIEDADANALASIQAELAADPSDYTVGADHSIEVQALETLGHYADWLGIRTQRLRDVNGFSFERAVVIGQRVRLDFSRIDPAAFEQRRTAYHREMQDAFFSRYQIEDIDDHVVRPGESLWVLAQRRYNVPVWLLRQYNPDLQLDRVRPGTVVKFPRLKPLTEGDAQA